MKLKELDKLPKGFLETDSRHLVNLFDGPTLIHLKGEQEPPLFVSILLHGNEISGVLAVQKFLKHFEGAVLPRSISLLVGNVLAAAEGYRHLDGQPDYNRIWAGGESEEEKLAAEVVSIMKEKKIFASIDIHNNTGKNPHYTCVNILHKKSIYLGGMFSDTMIYFTEPHQVLGMAFSRLGASTIIECGLPGSVDGVEKVAQMLIDIMELEDFPVNHNVKVYKSFARIKVPEQSIVSFDEDNSDCDFCFITDFDEYNFTKIKKGTVLFKRPKGDLKLSIIDDIGKDISDDILSYEGERVVLKKDIIPSMFTKDIRVIHQDCLGYLLYPIEY
ncbi:MAG: hypothetical protein HN509_03350 [Halobacteriovoraceae bacterium]|jgi:succinylglutamate desuccinylase|nr:hypothetical protein [Halobacteriovoraceae bacterium]MBT5094431.1 hypothetical protein [Halobacteriovoraceae bacterium]